MVPLADRTRAALQRSEGALRDLPVMGGVEENALVVFVAAAPTVLIRRKHDIVAPSQFLLDLP